jgi:lipopolysaccharide transport system ATP-binding protein
MCSEPLITLEGAGKAYALYAKPEDRLKQMVFGGRRTFYREFWALHPTDLVIRAGETWGIIGRNGSGKSTMLQMICGNLAPTAGRITVRGKVAALLELGAGFNPDFTGRENVYVNGALAGYDRDEMDARMDRILGFADIGEFVDQPVKTYSSGMFVRLAFSCAINVDPDILVIDEALAVGDARFQLKCHRRLDELKSSGATILFVSHAIETVKSLCSSAIVLDQGRTIYTGDAKVAAIKYKELLFPEQTSTDDTVPSATDGNPSGDESSGSKAPKPLDPTGEHRSHDLIVVPSEVGTATFGAGGASIGRIAIAGLDPPNILVGGRAIVIDAEFRWDKDLVGRLIDEEGYDPNITLGISLANAKGNYLFGCNGFDSGLRVDCLSRNAERFRFSFTVPHLIDDVYFLTAAIALGSQAKHAQLAWYDCFIELRCETVDRTVYGLFAIDYALESVGEDAR